MRGEQDRRALGEWGEQRAVEHLEREGWEVLQRNWAVSAGEVDVIASREQSRYGQRVEQVIFVEVKTRRVATQRARPEASVTRSKRERLVRLAKVWRKKKRDGPLERSLAMRFDVIAVEVGPDDKIRLRHIVGAFDERARVV